MTTPDLTITCKAVDCLAVLQPWQLELCTDCGIAAQQRDQAEQAFDSLKAAQPTDPEHAYRRTHETACRFVRGLGDWRTCLCPDREADRLRPRDLLGVLGLFALMTVSTGGAL